MWHISIFMWLELYLKHEFLTNAQSVVDYIILYYIIFWLFKSLNVDVSNNFPSSPFNLDYKDNHCPKNVAFKINLR